MGGSCGVRSLGHCAGRSAIACNCPGSASVLSDASTATVELWAVRTADVWKCKQEHCHLSHLSGYFRDELPSYHLSGIKTKRIFLPAFSQVKTKLRWPEVSVGSFGDVLWQFGIRPERAPRGASALEEGRSEGRACGAKRLATAATVLLIFKSYRQFTTWEASTYSFSRTNFGT